MTDVSIVIASYNTKDILRKTLLSIYTYTKNVSFEIILIDDASTDGSFEMIRQEFPKIIAIKNSKNLGYSKTSNKGSKLAKGRYILHLNSDVTFTKNTSLSKMVKFMENNPKSGILGCKVLRPDGKLDPPCKHAIPNLINTLFQTLDLYTLFPTFKRANYYMTYVDDNQTVEVGGLGAFMLIRKNLFKQIGYLDEQFFIYCEDTDFCLRAIKAGWKIFYFPKTSVMHMQGGSTKKFPIRSLVLFHKSIYLYYRKHHARNHSIFLNSLVYAGILFRFLFFLVKKFILYLTNNKI